MLLVTLANGALGASRGLAFPVNQFAADGVVAVAGRRGKSAAGFIERKRQQIRLSRFGPIHAGLPRGHLRNGSFGGVANAERREDFQPRVAGVDFQRHIWVRGQRQRGVGNPRLQFLEQREQLVAYIAMGVHNRRALGERGCLGNNPVGNAGHEHLKESSFVQRKRGGVRRWLLKQPLVSCNAVRIQNV